MRGWLRGVLAVALLCAGCGGGDGADGAVESRTADIDPCSLLSEDDLIAILGVAYPAEEGEPAGPFTNCSWGGGEVLVSVASSETVITAPGEDECPTANLGEESYACEGRVKFLTDGIHVTVSTISPLVEDEHLVELAGVVLKRLSG